MAFESWSAIWDDWWNVNDVIVPGYAVWPHLQKPSVEMLASALRVAMASASGRLPRAHRPPHTPYVHRDPEPE